MSDDLLNNGQTKDQPVGGKVKEGELSPGTMLGQYRIIRLLGRGGMGEVYEVEHTTLEKRYALKLLPDELASQKGFMERFRREAKVMAHLGHPNIVKVDEFEETKGKYWLRMELVQGVEVAGKKVRTLAELADSGGGRLEQGLLATILSQILDGLAYAHVKGAIHRDLKPGNVLLSGKTLSSVTVKIGDFGLVRLVGEEWVRSKAEQSVSISMSLGERATEPDKDKSGTSTRALLGTYEYMSPEQKRGEEVDDRSDLYAVGLMAFRLLTGQKEFSFELPSQIDNDLVKEWDEVVKKSLHPVREKRYNSDEEMAEVLRKIREAMDEQREGGLRRLGKGDQQIKKERQDVLNYLKNIEQQRKRVQRILLMPFIVLLFVMFFIPICLIEGILLSVIGIVSWITLKWNEKLPFLGGLVGLICGLPVSIFLAVCVFPGIYTVVILQPLAKILYERYRENGLQAMFLSAHNFVLEWTLMCVFKEPKEFWSRIGFALGVGLFGLFAGGVVGGIIGIAGDYKPFPLKILFISLCCGWLVATAFGAWLNKH